MPQYKLNKWSRQHYAGYGIEGIVKICKNAPSPERMLRAYVVTSKLQAGAASFLVVHPIRIEERVLHANLKAAHAIVPLACAPMVHPRGLRTCSNLHDTHAKAIVGPLPEPPLQICFSVPNGGDVAMVGARLNAHEGSELHTADFLEVTQAVILQQLTEPRWLR